VLTVVDLFAGVGGFSLGFMRASAAGGAFAFEHRLLADLDQTAAFTFKKTFREFLTGKLTWAVRQPRNS